MSDREPRTVAGRRLAKAGLTFRSGRRLADSQELIVAIEAEAGVTLAAPVRAEACGYSDKAGGPCILPSGHSGGHDDEDFGQLAPPSPDLAALRGALHDAIGMTDADAGLPHWHHATGGTTASAAENDRYGVFVDRKQVHDAIDAAIDRSTPPVPNRGPLPPLTPIPGLDLSHGLLSPEAKAELSANLRAIARTQSQALDAAGSIPLAGSPAKPDAERLDVARLTQAMSNVMQVEIEDSDGDVRVQYDSSLLDAKSIAAEYARLAAPTATEPSER